MAAEIELYARETRTVVRLFSNCSRASGRADGFRDMRERELRCGRFAFVVESARAPGFVQAFPVGFCF